MLPSSVVCIIQRIRKTASGFEEIRSSSFVRSSLVFFFAKLIRSRIEKKERERKWHGSFRLEKETVLETLLFVASEDFYRRNELK